MENPITADTMVDQPSLTLGGSMNTYSDGLQEIQAHLKHVLHAAGGKLQASESFLSDLHPSEGIPLSEEQDSFRSPTFLRRK